MSMIRSATGIKQLLGRSSRIFAQVTVQSYGSNQACPPAGPDTSNVKGLSEKVVNVPDEPVGPGAAKNKPYKNPEYFCYNTTSYFEAEVEMAKYRLPQPSNKTPMK